MEELEIRCNDKVVNLCVQEFLDQLGVPPDSDGISLRDRLDIFQSRFKDAAFIGLPGPSWQVLDQFARLAPDFIIGSGSSIPISTTTGLLPLQNSSTETILLYSVLEGMVQCAVARQLSESEFESEAKMILNQDADGYELALQLFTAYVWEKKTQDENDGTDSNGTPVADQMAKTAIHAFVGSSSGLRIYDSNEIKRLQGSIFQFKRPN